MTGKETAEILTLIQAEYPLSFSKIDKRQMAAKANLWADEFKNDSFELVYAAVRLLMKSGSEFAPNCGQIRRKMQEITEPDELTETQALAMITKACSNGIYGYKEEFAKLPPALQELVHTPEQLREWAMFDPETFQSVIGSFLMKNYRVGLQRAKDRKLLEAMPEETRAAISGITGRMELAEGKHV